MENTNELRRKLRQTEDPLGLIDNEKIIISIMGSFEMAGGIEGE